MSKKFLITMSSFATVLLVAFVVVLAFVLSNGKQPLDADVNIANWIYEYRGEKGESVYWFFRIVTEMGHYYFVIALLVVLAIFWMFKAKTWFLVAPVGLAWGTNEIIKLLVARPRPDEVSQWMVETSTSFPSGHSCTAVCLFLMIIFFVAISPKIPSALKFFVVALCWFAMFLVGFSRLVLGMHYFTDVMAGICLGALFAVLGMIAYHIFQNRKTKKQKSSV